MTSADPFLLRRYVLRVSEDLSDLTISPITEEGSPRLGPIRRCSIDDTPAPVLSSALGESLSAPSRLVAAAQTHAALLVGFPELESSEHELYRWPREEPDRPEIRGGGREAPPPSDQRHTTVVQPETGQVSQRGWEGVWCYASEIVLLCFVISIFFWPTML